MTLVERYVGGLTARRLELLAAQTRAEVAALRAQGVSITYLGSIAIPDEETCFCLFATESSIAVDAINRHLGGARAGDSAGFVSWWSEC